MLCFTASCLCGHSFLQSRRTRGWLLSSGLVAPPWCSHLPNLTSLPGTEALLQAAAGAMRDLAELICLHRQSWVTHFFSSIRTETSLWVTFYLRFPSQFLWAAFREDKTPGDWMDSLETISCRETAKGITTQDEPESTFTCFAGWHTSSPASCNYLGCLCL